jgi:hypothetical protein
MGVQPGDHVVLVTHFATHRGLAVAIHTPADESLPFAPALFFDLPTLARRTGHAVSVAFACLARRADPAVRPVLRRLGLAHLRNRSMPFSAVRLLAAEADPHPSP